MVWTASADLCLDLLSVNLSRVLVKMGLDDRIQGSGDGRADEILGVH